MTTTNHPTDSLETRRAWAKGERVRFPFAATRPVANFELDVGGHTGTVVMSTPDTLAIRMDEHFADLEEWDNEVTYQFPEDEGLVPTLELVGASR